MRHRLLTLALLLLAPALVGCAITVGGSTKTHDGNDRMDRLEKRIEALESDPGAVIQEVQ